MRKSCKVSIISASWGYLVFTLSLWLIIAFGGDRWWPAAMLLFGPRWIAGLPLIILLPLAAWKERRLLFHLIIGALVVFGPFMGLCLPLGKTRYSGGPVLRVLTCNLNSGNINASALASLIQETRADIVSLQECPREFHLRLPPKWRMLRDGELAVLSRYPLRPGISAQSLHPPHRWLRTSLLQCFVQAAGGDLTFCTVHLPSPRYGLEMVLDRKTMLSLSRKGLLIEEMAHRRKTSEEVSRMVAMLPGPVIVAGDFNMPVDSAIYRECWEGYENAFSVAGSGYGWTVRDNPGGISFGARIDHVLIGKGLGTLLCETGPDVGSDHLPLIADIVVRI